MQKISKNTKETEKIAKIFLKNLKPQKAKATVVGLYGDLGAGKTTFVQAIAKFLKLKKRVKSPTFVIIKNYALQNKNYKKLFHIDAYRLRNEKELIHLGWDEMISNRAHLIFIEWPENIIKALPQKHPKVYISHLATGDKDSKKEHRKFEIKKT